MWIKKEQHGIKLMLGIVALILLANCATSPQATETALPETATPDPLALQCIYQSGKNDFCYAGDVLADDTALLEEATRDFCLHNDDWWCYIFIWRDEESVAHSYPLTDAESSSLIAKFASSPNSGRECFQAFSDGEVLYKSGDCN